MNNPVVIITGGSGGLGKPTVRRFIESGAIVAVPVTSAKSADALKQYTGNSPKLLTSVADLTNDTSVKAFFNTVVEKFQRCDVLIHLVGGFWAGKTLAETPPEQLEKMLQLNLFTAFHCCGAAFRQMKTQKSGKIFTVGARAALNLPEGLGAYTTSKAALLAYTQTLAKEGAKYNIAVNAILPGTIDTPANRNAMPDADTSQWVTPEAIAEVLAVLADPNIVKVSETFIKM
jgi:NAD(P)-dependent dehydrogenase (short-subunit alcohol dehydrogenase family)